YLHQPLFADEMPNRSGFTAKTDQQVAADIRVAGDAAKHAIENLMLQAFKLHAAAAAVREGDHAVDVRKVVKRRRIEPPGNITAHGRRTVDRRDDCQIVSRAGPAVRSAIAEKRLTGERHRIGRNVGRARTFAGKLARREIMSMNPFSWLDRSAGEA